MTSPAEALALARTVRTLAGTYAPTHPARARALAQHADGWARLATTPRKAVTHAATR